MKTCMVCGQEKDLNQFRMRVRPPIQPYAACNSCLPLAYRKKTSAREEYAALKAKGESMRKLTPAQDVQIFKRVSAGETKRALSKEFGVAPNTIGKAYFRGAGKS